MHSKILTKWIIDVYLIEYNYYKHIQYESARKHIYNNADSFIYFFFISLNSFISLLSYFQLDYQHMIGSRGKGLDNLLHTVIT